MTTTPTTTEENDTSNTIAASEGRDTTRLSAITILLIFIAHLLPAQHLTSYVNPLIGTGGHGHTFPGAVVPFGMVALSPDTRIDGSWDGCGGYHYDDTVIYGFSHTHLSGTGCSDLGDIMLMPVSQITTDKNIYKSKFSHAHESAKAGHYQVLLDDDNIQVSLRATARAGFHTYTFPTTKSNRMVVLDLNHRDELLDGEIEIISNTKVQGYRRSKAWAADQSCFFSIEFSEPFEYIINQDGKKIPPTGESIWNGKKVAGCFAFKKGKEIQIKVGISGVDKAGARNNLYTEIPHWNEKRIYIQADSLWNAQLQKIKIDEPNEEQKTIFYTALYHCMIHPSIHSDVDHRYRGRDGKIHTAVGFDYYTVFSLWDTYRALHPLFTIIERERTVDFIKTFLAQYNQVGRLPIWELWGNETDCMIGYHAVSVITDAYSKGIKDFDTAKAFEAMKAIANSNWRGLDIYREKGYLEVDDEPESVSKTLEYAYDDWCIARMAQMLNKREEQAIFEKRGANWRFLYDHKTGFIRPRKNGGWLKPFDPFEVNNHYTEANGWQYNFSMPHTNYGFLYNKWDSLFTVTNKTSGRDQADISGLIGQYAHGNEPSHHIAFLFNDTLKPEIAGAKINYILKNFYKNTPDGIIGNEDCGQMSAWYIFASLGYYPVCPGKNEYASCKALFNSSNFPALPVYNHTAPSNQTLNIHGAPIVIEAESELFRDSLLVSIVTHDDNLLRSAFRIAYSIGLNTGNQIPYKKPFYIHQSQEITGYFFKHPYRIGEQEVVYKSTARFHKIPNHWNIQIQSIPHAQYTAGGSDALIDGMYGKTEWRMGRWMGFQGQDLEAVITLNEDKEITELGSNYLQDQLPWIMMPKEVIYYTSQDNVNYTEVGRVQSSTSDKDINVTTKSYIYTLEKPIKAKYIKVKAVQYGPLPNWHISAGEKSYIFADEIWVK
jgi:predicted alpha-1,2-mannosidase